MKIRLKEIPQEGRSYEYDRASGELTEELQDLIGDHEYKVSLFIKPIGSAYEMRGSLATSVTEICSNCGYDFDLPLERKINEILFEDMDEDRKAQSVHGNQSVDFLNEGPSMTPVKGEIFDPGAYTHELIGLTEPFYPMCGPNGDCLRRDEVAEIKRKLEADFELAEKKAKGHPAFSVLKGLDLNKKN